MLSLIIIFLFSLEFVIYFNVAVQHVSHYATETLPDCGLGYIKQSLMKKWCIIGFISI